MAATKPYRDLEPRLNYTFTYDDKEFLVRALCTSASAAARIGLVADAEGHDNLALIGRNIVRLFVAASYLRSNRDRMSIMKSVLDVEGADTMVDVGRWSDLKDFVHRNEGQEGDLSARQYCKIVMALVGAAFMSGGMTAANTVAQAMDVVFRGLDSAL